MFQFSKRKAKRSQYVPGWTWKRKEKKIELLCFHRCGFEPIGPTLFKSPLIIVVGFIAILIVVWAHFDHLYMYLHIFGLENTRILID